MEIPTERISRYGQAEESQLDFAFVMESFEHLNC